MLVLARGDGFAADDHHQRVVVVLQRTRVVVAEGDLLGRAVAAAVARKLLPDSFDVAPTASLGALAPGRPVRPLTTEDDV